MEMEYSLWELMLCVLVYGFLGWVVRVAVAAVKQGRFASLGFLNLPLSLRVGVTMGLTVAVLPTLPRNLGVWLLAVWLLTEILERLAEQLRGTGEKTGKRHFAWSLPRALAYLTVYLVVHPFVFAPVALLPETVAKWTAIGLWTAVALDYLGVWHLLRTKLLQKAGRDQQERTRRLADRISAAVWDRLRRSYPGIDEGVQGHVFARGLCFDKLVWVFLISSFLGALIEMVFCRVTGGVWMNRSSVLYGAFSFVWGFGAVVLTVALRRFADQEDRKVFLAGFLVGGAYEYLASVFTEVVFGTVFWDYSHMPLNIGGRTNVLYCLFWGILAVVWLKVLYPPMDRSIERLPPLTGKVLTWAVVLVLVCDGVLTCAAMARYTTRRTRPEPAGFVETYLDQRYDDRWMENRWPNMKITAQ